MAMAPCSVNLIALPTRFSSTWRIRTASPTSCAGSPGPWSTFSASALLAQTGATIICTSRITTRGSKGRCSMVMRPASSFEKSRMSLMTFSRWLAEVRM